MMSKRAFNNALDVFRKTKTFRESTTIIGKEDFSPTEHDRGILANMILKCERFLSGELDAKTALYHIQRLYDSLNNKGVSLQRAMENLKTAVG